MMYIQLRTPTHAEKIIVEEETEKWFVSSCGKTYPKTHYMKIEVPQWRNATSELEIREPVHKGLHREQGGIYHNGKCIAQLCCGGKYRLQIDGHVATIQQLVS